jgi:hypothetical protein
MLKRLPQRSAVWWPSIVLRRSDFVDVDKCHRPRRDGRSFLIPPSTAVRRRGLNGTLCEPLAAKVRRRDRNASVRLHAVEGREARALNSRVARSIIIVITSSATSEPFRSGKIARLWLSSMREKSARDVRSASLPIDAR